MNNSGYTEQFSQYSHLDTVNTAILNGAHHMHILVLWLYRTLSTRKHNTTENVQLAHELYFVVLGNESLCYCFNFL